ncbi:MAG: YHS domain-containing (seleno)protein [Planctomycetota bacterium]
MHLRTVLALASALALAPFAPADASQAASSSNAQQTQQDELHRNIDEWDLPKNKLAIGGYDPVAYFPEGGSKATKGSKKITAQYRGVTYRFKTDANKERFLANPTRYEPAHGGWCSYAMLEGEKTEPDPKNYIVKGDRLFLFYKGFFGDTKKEWEKTDHQTSANTSDASWKTISGEEKRAVKAVQ